MLVAIVILAVAVVGLGFVCYKLYTTNRELRNEQNALANYQTAITNAKSKLDELETRYVNELQQLENIYRKRQEELNNKLQDIQAQIVIQIEQNQIKLEESLSSLSDGVAAKRAEETQIAAKIKSLLDKKVALEHQLTEITAQLNCAKTEQNELTNQIQSVKTQHKEATRRLTLADEGRILAHNQSDILLTNTLEELKLQYPSLASAFAKIQWENVWQTKFQAMTVDLQKNEKCGIYRIWTIENGVIRNYVGQAKKIRDRWSQHIKKMLGVAVADNNKFYSAVKPFNAHFEIIEECEEHELNAKERYWIDYYNCVEDGYNSRT